MSKQMLVIPKESYVKMAENLPFSTEQLNMLFKPTPKEYIRTRQMPGGGTADYVSGHYVENMLNFIFGFHWDFEVIEEEIAYGQIVLRGKLTVKGKDGETVSKTQYGRALIKFKKGTEVPLDYGNDKKAAATDALKKCASWLGIAWDVYGQEDFNQMKIQDTALETNNEVDSIESLIEKATTAEELTDKFNSFPADTQKLYAPRVAIKLKELKNAAQ